MKIIKTGKVNSAFENFYKCSYSIYAENRNSSEKFINVILESHNRIRREDAY